LIRWIGTNFGKLLEARVNKYLIRKIEKIYDETEMRIKMKQG